VVLQASLGCRLRFWGGLWVCCCVVLLCRVGFLGEVCCGGFGVMLVVLLRGRGNFWPLAGRCIGGGLRAAAGV